MNIRRAMEKDADGVLTLLSQVLELHAKLRPDIFISGTTKYNREELLEIFNDKKMRVYVAADDNDDVCGYAVCVIKEQPFCNNMIPFTTLYVDDLCVDEKIRGQHVGRELFEYVKNEAKALGCYEVTLNVWEGNDSARAFYEKMGMRPKETQMEIVL